MKKNKFLKRFFAVAFSFFILSALVIPCFADTEEGEGFWVGENSNHADRTAYVDFLNSSGISDYPWDTVDPLSNYRYVFLTGYTVYDSELNPYSINSSICDLLVDSEFMTYTPHFGSGFYYVTWNLNSSNHIIVSVPHTVSNSVRKYSNFDFKSSQSIACQLTVYYSDYSTISSIESINPNSITEVCLSITMPGSVSLANDLYDVYPLGSSGTSYSLRFLQRLYLKEGTTASNTNGIWLIDNNDDRTYFSDFPSLCIVRNSSLGFLDTFCNYSASPNVTLSFSSSDIPNSSTDPINSDPQTPEEEAVSVLGSLRDFVFALFQSPAVFLSSMLDFTIFGVNLYGVLKVILTLSLTALVIGVVVKIILHFKS